MGKTDRDRRYYEQHKEKILLARKMKIATKRANRIKYPITKDESTANYQRLCQQRIESNIETDLYNYITFSGKQYYKHIVVYYSAFVNEIINLGTVVAWCQCGPVGRAATHYHLLMRLQKNYERWDMLFDKFEPPPHRKNPIRSMDIKCIKYFLSCIHYIGCRRASAKTAFKKEDHCHRDCHSSFPTHNTLECSTKKHDIYLSFQGFHPPDCKCLTWVNPIKRKEEKPLTEREKFQQKEIIAGIEARKNNRRVRTKKSEEAFKQLHEETKKKYDDVEKREEQFWIKKGIIKEKQQSAEEKEKQFWINAKEAITELNKIPMPE